MVDPNQKVNTNPHIALITDVFTGADGGVAFVKFCSFMQNMEQQAVEGNAAAKDILQIVKRFARLLEVASK